MRPFYPVLVVSENEFDYAPKATDSDPAPHLRRPDRCTVAPYTTDNACDRTSGTRRASTGPGHVPPGSHPGTSVVMGGPLEAATDFCTRRLAQRLDTLGIHYTAHFRPDGTHSWPYWADELVNSWPTIAGGLGID